MTQQFQTMRAEMLDKLRHQLVPALQSRGFVKREASPQERSSDEMQTAFPLGKFQRQDGLNLQLVEIQLDKHGAPKFVINFGIAPPGGVTLPWGHFEQSKLNVSSLSNAFRLYKNPRWQQWFGGGLIPFKGSGRLNSAVADATAALQEIDDWFQHGTVGRHVRRFGLPTSTTT